MALKEEKKKILILSAGPQTRLISEFKKLDYECDVYAPDQFYCYLSNAIGYDRLYLKGNDDDPKNKRIKIKDYLAIVPRISGAGFQYGLLIVKHVSENLGIFTTASEFGLSTCSNKFQTCQFLSRHRIRVPKQILAHKLSDYKETIEQTGGFPFVLKLQRGSQGAGVFLIRDQVDASQTLRALEYTDQDLVLSEKLNSGDPANDLRIWVIGAFTDEPKIYGYKRFALADDFRSNYSLSGSGEKVTLTEEEKLMALRCAIALKMNIAAVDIMRHLPNPDKKNDFISFVLEVNGNPGLSGIEAVTGNNIAGEVAKFVVNNYKKGNTWDSSLSKSLDMTEIQIMKWLAERSLNYLKESNSRKSEENLNQLIKNINLFVPDENKSKN